MIRTQVSSIRRAEALRRQYRDILVRKLGEGGFAWLGGAALRLGAVWLGARAGRPLAGPLLGTLVITYRCNYSCEFCELPARAVRRRREGTAEFDAGEMRTLIRGFKAIRTAAVGITGGEPFLREDLFDVLAEIRRLGMVAHVNTNGHFLTPENVRRLIRTGLESVNISLDAPDAATHNRIRGNRRSFDRILAGIEEIRRRRRGKRPRIGLTTVLTGATVEKALEMAELARDLGVDSLGFLPVHEYHEGGEAAGLLPRREFAERAREALRHLVEEDRTVLENSPAYLSLFPRCFEGRPSGLRCYAPQASVVVDCYGRVFPCVPYSEIDEPIAVIQAGGLPACWRSRRYAEARKRLARCQACYWNCHTELNLLFQRVPR